MKKEILEQIRTEYKKIKEQQLSNYQESTNLKHKIITENNIINLAYNSVPYQSIEKEFFSNHIMIYMGSYIMDRNTGFNDYLTYDNDPKANYKKYMDLETSKNYSIEIDRCSEFEDVFTVLYFVVKSTTEHEYRHAFFTLQNYFKSQILTRTQEDVIDDLKILYKKSKTK